MTTPKAMLAAQLTDLTTLPDRVWAVEPKLDGIRVIVTADPAAQLVTYHTRNGNPLLSLEALTPDILRLAEAIGSKVVMDGEATAGTDFFTGVGKLRQKSAPAELACLTLFDLIEVDSWGNSADAPYSLRRDCLETMFQKAGLEGKAKDSVRMTPVIDTLTTADLQLMADGLLEDALALGFEGLMLKDVDAGYTQGKRTRAWIKLKPSETYDCRIVGFIPGTGRLDGTLGSLLVSYNGKPVRVGSGMTDLQRQEIYDNQAKYIGALAEVSCLSLTPAGSLRHPSLVCIRWDK
jgi:ATP-dependent DNA ligase